MTFSAVESGLLRRCSEQLGRRYPDLRARTRIFTFIGFTYLPLVVLAAIEGVLFGGGWVFSRDVAAPVRFLWVGPLLIGLEFLIRRELGAAVEGWRSDGLVPLDRRAAFDRSVSLLQRLQHSWWTGIAVLLGAYVLAWLEVRGRLGAGPRIWLTQQGGVWGLSLAGWWYALLSAPLLYTLLLRWIWRLVLWGLLLLRLARLPLRVLALHPDRRGGLDVVTRAHNLFAGFLLAISSLAAAALANQLIHLNHPLSAARSAALVFLVVSLVVFLSPLAAFTPLLLRLRRRAASLFGEAAARHTIDFERAAARIVASGPGSAERIPDALLENQANFAQSFDSLREMKSNLLTLAALKLFGLAAVVPLLLAALSKVPAAELLGKLRSLLL